jgi:SAM-dependent methyltransferase
MATATPNASAPLSATDRVLIDDLTMLEEAMQRNYAWVYDVIAPWLGSAVLEVGSGVGTMSKYLVARGGPVVLSDHHPAYLEILRARFAAHAQVAFQLLDLMRPPLQVARPVDTVVCLSVLEHLEDDRLALRALADVLPAGGRLVLQVPNYPCLFGSLDLTYGHFRRYSRRDIAARLSEAGLSVVSMRNFNPLAIAGWVLSGKLRRTGRIDRRSARLYNAIVPLARRLDFLAHLGGLALIVCAERPRGPALR